MNIKVFAIAILLACNSAPTYAALFGEKEPVKTIKPDAALGLDGLLTLDFAWRADLGFDAKKLDIIVTYAATKPDAKGIKMITEETCMPNPRLPVGGSCSKYTHPLEYAFQIPAAWISQTANKIKLQLPERIKGAGDYQLVGLRFNCSQSLCKGKKSTHEGLYDSDYMLSFTTPSKDNKQHTLLRGHDLATSFTGQYSGVLLGLIASEGAYNAEDNSLLSQYQANELGKFYDVLQDKMGNWHLGELAFRTRYEGSCQSNYNGPSIQANKYDSMKWAQAFPAATYGSVYDTYVHNNVFDKNSKRIELTPSQWTGCVSFKAENPETSAAGNEERQYTFENGKLYKRRIQRYVEGVSLDETIYLDAQFQLSTYKRLQFVDKTQKETNLIWGKVEHAAYPQTKPAPSVDLKALQREAADVLKIIAPEFTK
jgi:hypothetical protein